MSAATKSAPGARRARNAAAFLLAWAVVLAAPGATRAQESSRTGTNRPAAEEIHRLGWNGAGLDKVVAFAKSLGTDTLLIVSRGKPVASLGDASRRYNVHSIRKVLLSALVGQQAGRGSKRIDLDATLAQLGIDDSPNPLSPRQKRATVRHLVRSVSGINHWAAAEEGQREERTRRLGTGENEPGSKWAYNNWDYNALTTIFERRTGLSVGAAFMAGIAGPAGMADFSPADVSYIAAPRVSRHRAAMFRMSGRDLALFGRLYLNGGTLDGKRLLPRSWIDRIAAETIGTGMGGMRAGHSYLWWVPALDTGLPAGSFWALGIGHQAVIVVPAWRTVIVHQADTTVFFRRFLGLIRNRGMTPNAALESLALSCLGDAGQTSGFCRNDRFILRGEFDRLVSLIVAARR